MELRNVPTQLILYAGTQWSYCGKYTVTGKGKNTNPFLQAIAVWLILKNETSSGRIHNYRKQLQYLSELCKLKQRSMDSRLAWLKSEGLVKVQGKDLLMSEYKSLSKYDINIKEREQTIFYDTTNETSLSDIIITIALDKMKDNWKSVYWKKMSKNPDALAEVRNHLIAFSADESQLDDLEYFRERHLHLLIKSYKEESPGQSSFYLLHNGIDANPDNNVRQDTYADKLGLSAAMSFVHIKFRLIKRKLISVIKQHVRSEYRARKDEKIFHHRWLEDAKQTIWFRPDQITINRSNFYAP